MTTQHDQRNTPAPPTLAEWIRRSMRDRLRAADKLRMEYMDAAYTPIGQRALVMLGTALLVLVINLATLGVLLFH